MAQPININSHTLRQGTSRFGAIRLQRDDSQPKRFAVQRWHEPFEDRPGLWMDEDRFKTLRAAKALYLRWLSL